MTGRSDRPVLFDLSTDAPARAKRARNDKVTTVGLKKTAHSSLGALVGVQRNACVLTFPVLVPSRVPWPGTRHTADNRVQIGLVAEAASHAPLARAVLCNTQPTHCLRVGRRPCRSHPRHGTPACRNPKSTYQPECCVAGALTEAAAPGGDIRNGRRAQH